MSREEISKWIILEARAKQIQLIKLVELVRTNFMASLPGLVDESVRDSLEFLRGEFDSDKKFEKYVEEKISDDLNLYPLSLWNSLFVQSFFFFENDLKELCKMLNSWNNYNVKLSDLKGRGIYRARKYLTKVVGIDFNPLEDCWQTITISRKLRNCISHRSGNIKKSNNETALRSFFKKRDDSYIDEEGNLCFDERLIIHSADVMREFWLGFESEFYENTS